VAKRTNLLTEEQEARLRENVKRSPLARTHVLLRRHGWKPERVLDGNHWVWKKRGRKEQFSTWRLLTGHVFWERIRRNEKDGFEQLDHGDGRSVSRLARLLKELAQ